MSNMLNNVPTCLEFWPAESTRMHISKALPDFVFSAIFFMSEWMTLVQKQPGS